MAVSSDRKAAAHASTGGAAAPRVRRSYFDCRYGQLHVHHVMPAGGGFDEATTLLCIPGAPGSGRAFYGLLSALGKDRSSYAPDLPGSAESDPAPAGAGPGELAGALADFLDSMRFRRVNVIAYGSGGAVALALIEARRNLIGKLVLSATGSLASPVGLPVLQVDLGISAESGARPLADAVLLRLTEFLGMN
jgi:pimeloyl-ACP methyl ester carboxylesterase